jgi:hypothetical protein
MGDRNRRALRGPLALLVAGLALAACAVGQTGSDDDGGTSTSSTSATGGTSGVGGSGGQPACETPADCPGQDSTCSARVCVEGACDVELASDGTACMDDGGSVCTDGACVDCLVGEGCPDGVCLDNVCVAATCVDTVLNGAETDVDCGGQDCGPCANGEMCLAFTDCVSQFCDSAVSPPLCAPCVDDVDCSSAPGTYCDAGLCVALLDNGAPCAAPNECSSGYCPVDGICCDAPCDAACDACSMTSTMQADGTCSPNVVCVNADGCCPAGCNDMNDSDCMILDLAVGVHGSVYSAGNATRGMWFTAPVAFTIVELRVPTSAGSGPQNLQVVKFTATPPGFPTTTTGFTTVHYSTGTPGTGFVPVNIPVLAGDVVGILGSRGSGTLTHSYSTTNPVNTTVFGQAMTLNRLVYQANMVTAQAGPLSNENGGSLGRVELRYSP